MTSHESEQIKSLCSEVLVLEEGRVMMHGDPENAIHCYDDLMRQRTEKRAVQLFGKTFRSNLAAEYGSRLGTQEAMICAVQLCDAQGKAIDSLYSGDGLTIRLEYMLTKPLPDLALILGIYSEANIKCFETQVPFCSAAFGPLTERGRFSCYLPELPLLPGRYYINVGLYPTNWDYVYDYHWQMHPLHVMKGNGTLSGSSGVISLRPVWSVLRV
jgi:ABC-type polysaccharide/polyol phosphate transport system, ATPase component